MLTLQYALVLLSLHFNKFPLNLIELDYHCRHIRRHRHRRYKNIDADVAGCDGCCSSCAVVAANGVISWLAPGSRYMA